MVPAFVFGCWWLWWILRCEINTNTKPTTVGVLGVQGLLRWSWAVLLLCKCTNYVQSEAPTTTNQKSANKCKKAQISPNDNNQCDDNAPAAMQGAKINKVWMQRSNDLCDATKQSATTRCTWVQQYDMMGGTNNEGAKWSIKKPQWDYMRVQCNNMKQDNAELEIKNMRGKAEVISFLLKVLCTGLLSYENYKRRLRWNRALCARSIHKHNN